VSWLLVRYDRDGAARYLSHLDTARALQRTFARAAVSVAQSQGMRPKARLSLGLPLPVGAAARDELVLVELAQPPDQGDLASLRDRLRAAAPAGLTVTQISWIAERPRLQPLRAEYECVVRGDPVALQRAVESFREREEVVVERVSPKGRKVVDLKRYVEAVWARPRPDGLHIGFTIRHTQSGAARPEELVRFLAECAGAEPITRDLLRRGVAYRGLPETAVGRGTKEMRSRE